jgi:hypothetical protein
MEDREKEVEKEPCHCAVSRCPSSFSTPAQLLRLRNDSFFRHQSHLKASLSNLTLKPSYSYLQQFSAVVGFIASHSQALLPGIVVSEQDPLAGPALASILGRECGVDEEGVTLLDRLDLPEVIGDWLANTHECDRCSKPMQRSTGAGTLSHFEANRVVVATTVFSNPGSVTMESLSPSVVTDDKAVATTKFASSGSQGSTGIRNSSLVADVAVADVAVSSTKFAGLSDPHSQEYTCMGGSSVVAVDMAMSSILQDTERLAHLALSSVQTLFQSLGAIPIPRSSAVDEVSRCVSLDTVPVHFQRVCLLLRQHIYWVPASQLDWLPWQRVQNNNDESCVVQTCTVGPSCTVRCVSVSCFPLECLLRWYQMVNFFRQLQLQIEPTTSDIQRLLTDILTL